MLSDVFHISGNAEPERLSRELDGAWRSGLESGTVAYDPASARIVRSGRYRYRCLPGRSTRPRTPLRSVGPSGVLRPHESCVFDTADFLAEREVLRLEFGTGRQYHVVVNRFPVTSHHFVAIRPGTDPEETLTQSILSESEIEEMATLLRALGPPYRVYYNSNRGRDGSSSGSSINHWHFQFLSYPHGLTPAEEFAGEPIAEFRRCGSARVAELTSWSASAHVFEGSDLAELSRITWQTLRRVIAEDRAYNFEGSCSGDAVRFYIFPKSPGPEHEISGAGVLTADFGGLEMGGDIVLPSEGFLRWFEEHPEDGERLTTDRLKECTSLVR